MRKEILLPGIAVAGGAAGLALRRWELATAFEPPEAGFRLHIPGSPATYALICLSAVLLLAFLLLSRGKHRAFSGGYGAAFAAKGNTLYITAAVLSGFLLLCSAVLNFMGLPAAYQTALEMVSYTHANPVFSVLPRVLLGIMSAAAFLCTLITARGNYRGEGKGRYSGSLLVPAYACCIWLIAAYQVRAGDPVTLDYIYELLAIIASLLAFYFIAGFSFEKAKTTRACLFSALGVYFSLVTLADGPELYLTALYGFTALSLTVSMAVLLHNDRQPEPKGPRMPPSTEEAEIETTETEVTPDE